MATPMTNNRGVGADGNPWTTLRSLGFEEVESGFFFGPMKQIAPPALAKF